ncbi:MAG: LptF/LptG family permease [Bacteriovoracaceae bacterium]|nr:LptF/LptG family permease [Bacteriovoracaceae bacterium]
MKKIIHKYLAGHFIVPFLVSTLFFVFFMLTFQLFKIVSIVFNKDVPLATTLELIFHIALTFLPMAIPLSLLFAILYLCGRLSGDSEIIAMRSFGFSKFSIYKPFLLLTVFMGFSIIVFNQTLMPHSKKIFKKGITILTAKGLMAEIKQGQFFTEIENLTLFSEKVSEGGKNMQGVFIHYRLPHEGAEQVIFSEKGFLIKEEANEWGFSPLRFKLRSGNIIKTYGHKKDIEKILFAEYDFPVPQADLTIEIASKNSTLTGGEIWNFIQKGQSDFSKNDFFKLQMEFWTRINDGVSCVVFGLLGFVFGISRPRGRPRTGALSLAVILIYYSLFFLGISFSQKGFITPLIAVFTPSLLGILMGIYFYRRLDWSS